MMKRIDNEPGIEALLEPVLLLLVAAMIAALLALL
jgi:hypothetical protein